MRGVCQEFGVVSEVPELLPGQCSGNDAKGSCIIQAVYQMGEGDPEEVVFQRSCPPSTLFPWEE